MTTSPLGDKHSCVSWLFMVNSHLYFTLWVGGVLHPQAALPSGRATTQLITDKPNGQHAPHSQQGRETDPVDSTFFIKSSLLDVTEPNVSTKLPVKPQTRRRPTTIVLN